MAIGTTNAGNGGRFGLDIKIVGGTTQPLNPREHTIWVNTDAQITGYTISSVVPKNPSEGHVWIQTSDSGIAIDVGLTDEYLWHLFSAEIYENGAWVYLNASVYNDGKWGQFSFDLVPSDYQAVEYINSDGAQYIRTDIVPLTTMWGFELDVDSRDNFTSSSNSGAFFGVIHNNGYFSAWPNYGGFYWIGATRKFGLGFSANKRIKMIAHRGKVYGPNGDIVDATIPDAAFNYPTTFKGLTIFCGGGEGNIIGTRNKFKLYRLKIFDETDALVADFVPCYRREDNEPGLWDRVRHIFYSDMAKVANRPFTVGGNIV